MAGYGLKMQIAVEFTSCECTKETRGANGQLFSRSKSRAAILDSLKCVSSITARPNFHSADSTADYSGLLESYCTLVWGSQERGTVACGGIRWHVGALGGM